MSTPSENLAEARQSLHAAVAAHEDPGLRRQHAHHAGTLAADVVFAADSTDEQRRTAALYLEQAQGWTQVTPTDATSVGNTTTGRRDTDQHVAVPLHDRH